MPSSRAWRNILMQRKAAKGPARENSNGRAAVDEFELVFGHFRPYGLGGA